MGRLLAFLNKLDLTKVKTLVQWQADSLGLKYQTSAYVTYSYKHTSLLKHRANLCEAFCGVYMGRLLALPISSNHLQAGIEHTLVKSILGQHPKGNFLAIDYFKINVDLTRVMPLGQ
jgi:hypothetical protein